MKTFLCVLLLISIPARAADPLSVLLPRGLFEDLAKTKASAERGDASAQHQLGNAYYRHFYFGKAAEWYQKAADQGHREALFSLAQILQTGKPAMKKDGSPVPKNEEQAFRLFYRAANLNHRLAQLEVGRHYQEGRIVKQDRVEAYKWIVLAGTPGRIIGKVELDRLTLALTQEQIQEGQRKADQFRPKRKDDGRGPLELVLASIKLRAIVGTRAFINDRMLSAGDDAELKTPDGMMKIRCLSIDESSVLLEIQGITEPQRFYLRPHK